MASIDLSFTVTPNAKATAIVDAFCAEYGYDPTAGKTQVEFIKSQIKDFVLMPYIKARTAALDQVTRTTMKTDVEGITFG